MQAFLDGIDFLKSHQVLIGIPESSGPHDGNLTNVELAFIMSNGSPLKGIPPRPFIEPALDDAEVKSKIAREMGNAAKAAIEGSFGEAMNSLGAAGMIGQSAIQVNMGGTPPPNKESTIRRKGSDVTLIDTVSLRKAIAYVVEGG